MRNREWENKKRIVVKSWITFLQNRLREECHKSEFAAAIGRFADYTVLHDRENEYTAK